MPTQAAEQILASAMASTGLSDFGPQEFQAPLRVLGADLDDPTLAGGLADTVAGFARVSLEKRLRLLARRKTHSEIGEEVIDRPVFVIGLPRTGTSALVDLMAQDPAARAPLQWEVKHLDELDDRASWSNDPRIDALEADFQRLSEINPVVALGLHTYGARLPEECNSFMSMSLWSPSLAVHGHLPRYSEWIRFATLQNPYRLHRYVLQHLQHYGRGGRWTLKSPWHVFDLPAILDEYPDAVFIQTHRDPLQLMPSMCGLYATIRGQGPGDPGRRQTGRELANLWGTGLQRGMIARRDPALDARVFDISHRALLDDPLNVLRSVYERFGWGFTSEAETQARNWIKAPAQHLSSVKFSLGEFGLDEAAVEAAFGDYRERFGSLF